MQEDNQAPAPAQIRRKIKGAAFVCRALEVRRVVAA
jgi:hypothetical protein